MHLKVVVEGKPMGQPRPRFDPRSKRTYTPEKATNYKTFVKWLAIDAKKEKGWDRIDEGPVEIYIDAFFPIPTSWPKKKQLLAEKGLIYPTVKADFDNIEKTVTDAMSGIVYGDDKQVCHCNTWKRYSREPRVEILVQPLSAGVPV